MGKFTPTNKQELAFKEVAKAIKKAKRLGLVFSGKSDSLVAYKRNANDYIESRGFSELLGTGMSQIECISETGLINDSGADDYPDYENYEDQENYS